MTRRRDILSAALFALIPAALGCEDEDVMDPTAVAEPAALFWDHLWTVHGTYAELAGAAMLPYPTDAYLLERIRYGQDGGPPVNDVLEGAELTFELDGRLLVRPAGAEAAEYLAADYRVVDHSVLRASVRKSAWRSYTYLFDETSRSLLIQPEAETGGALVELVLEIVQRTLFSGALDSAAARISRLVLEDPRVTAALDAFVFALVNAELASVPVESAGDVTAWIIALLRETGVVAADASDESVGNAVAPVVERIRPLASEGIERALVDGLLEAEIVTQVVVSERAERVLRFALYRHALETGGHLALVRRLDLLLERSS